MKVEINKELIKVETRTLKGEMKYALVMNDREEKDCLIAMSFGLAAMKRLQEWLAPMYPDTNYEIISLDDVTHTSSAEIKEEEKEFLY